MSKLRAVDISISFGGLEALDSVGIDVEPGEIRGIIGPNGARKTTLLNVICGINAPDTGTVWLHGELEFSTQGAELADNPDILRSHLGGGRY